MQLRIAESCNSTRDFVIGADPTMAISAFPSWPSFYLIEVAHNTCVVSTFKPTRRAPKVHVTAGTAISGDEAVPGFSDATRVDDLGLGSLEALSAKGDEVGFVRAASRIDWASASTSDFVRAVQLALRTGAHALARELAHRGSRRYSDSLDLNYLAQLLAPPSLRRHDLEPDSSPAANRAWLASYAVEYRGQWVALRNGVLLAAATSVASLRARLVSLEGAFITKVR